MLVITRKKNEEIVIGDNIKLKIISIDNGSVKIAVDAPKEVSIFRKELYDEVLKENLKAASINLDVLKAINNRTKKD